MRDAEQVRGFLRAEHPALLGTALLLTGERGSAGDLVGTATWRVMRRGGARRLTAVAVRDEMARVVAGGRVPSAQVLDAGPLADAGSDLGPLAAALDDLPPPARTVAVLRLADDLPVDEVAGILTLPADEVRALEREALDRLGAVEGSASRLPGRLDALAAVPPDPAAPDRVADTVLARRRNRRTTAALVAAGLIAAVPVGSVVADRPGAAPVAAADPAGGSAEDPPPEPVEVLTGPPRGSLAEDEAFLEAARRVPWGTDDDPPPEARRAAYAADTAAGRVALVVGDTPSGLEGAWLLGPPGAAADELVPRVPERIGRSRPAAVLVEGADATAVVVVAAPGDAVELSARLRSEPSGAVARTWQPVPVDDGTAVVELRSSADGPAAAVRIVRDGQVVARPVVTGPDRDGEDPPPLTLEPVRPGTAEADPVLVADALARVARPFGVEPGALSPHLLWSAELTRTGGLGRVVVLAARVPGNAHVVTALGRLGEVRGGLEVPCGTTSFPAELPPSTMSVAMVCSVYAGSEVDRTWLLVTAPAAAESAEVLDDGGGVLDVLSFEGGGAMTRTPDGAALIRIVDGDDETYDVIPITPSAEAPFGDYGDG
jgi:DNA-directed RNA polymerase specialized sigma24 family protein